MPVVSMNAVPVARDISPETFLHENVLKRQPLLIKGALKEWKALQWTPEYLKQAAGSQILSYRTEEGVKQGNFGELIDRIFYTDKPAPYLRNVDLGRELPTLAHDIEPALPYCSRNWRDHFLMPRGWPADVRKDLYEVFISRKNESFPYLHIDYWGMSAFMAQLYGRKEVILFPAEDARYLYPTAANPLMSSIRDFDNPDYETFPEFRHARQYRVVLEPGDLLFNPGWWHTTKTLAASVTVIWAYWNRHEWEDLLDHVRARMSRKYRVALLPYLRFVGMCNRLSPG
jgi:histone arginine demethylase JMJD6